MPGFSSTINLLVLIILRTLPIQWQNLLPYARAGAKHRRRNRRHRVAEQMVNEVATFESSTTNLPNGPNRLQKPVVPFLLPHLNFSLGTY